jgi:anti-sigma factor RsiW
MKSKCLTDMEIVAYVDGVAAVDIREKVESHIATCTLCLHSVAELKHLVDAHEASPVHTPEAALSRAFRIVEAGMHATPELSIVAALRQGLVKILETTGSLLPPPRLTPVPVRKKKGAGLVPRVARSLSGYLVTVELSAEEGRFTADITLVDEASSEQPDGVKVKLHSAGASETRYSRSGRVRFTSLDAGTSDLEIEGIGRISLEIQ